MITEDYVSFEVAKLLDKKGFREYCEAIYFILENGDYRWSKIDIPIRDCSTCKPAAILCPSHQMTMKWLRKNDIIISISPTMNVLNAHNGYLVSIDRIVSGKLKYEQEFGLDTYEEAVEEALKYSLENLI